MARPLKEGLDYFPLDCSFFADRKIKALKARFGADGITLYVYILCEIYKEGYFLKIEDDFDYLTGDELNMSPGKVKQILAFLVSRSLLVSKLISPDTTIITSEGIQKRFQEAIKSRASKTPRTVDGRIWLLKISETETYIKVTQKSNSSKRNRSYSKKNLNDSEINDTKKSKVNKSKVKKSKVNEKYGKNEGGTPSTMHTLKDAMEVFIAYRKEKGKPLYGKGVELLLEDLEQMAPNNEQMKIDIIRQSMKSGWTSLYPYKDNTKSNMQNNTSPKTRFHNFEQRDTDYDAILRERRKVKDD